MIWLVKFEDILPKVVNSLDVCRLFSRCFFANHFLISETVLDSNCRAARLLADVVHDDLPYTTPQPLLDTEQEISEAEIGVWIDPIGKNFYNVSPSNS